MAKGFSSIVNSLIVRAFESGSSFSAKAIKTAPEFAPFSISSAPIDIARASHRTADPRKTKGPHLSPHHGRIRRSRRSHVDNQRSLPNLHRTESGQQSLVALARHFDPSVRFRRRSCISPHSTSRDARASRSRRGGDRSAAKHASHDRSTHNSHAKSRRRCNDRR